MEGISDLKIVGIDERRPPMIRKQPYIDIFFKLSHQAPADWCTDFNNLLSKHPSTPKIDSREGLYIEGWVRTPDAVVEFLDQLKTTVTECTRLYIERIELAARNTGDQNSQLATETGEQGRLNKIIAGLEFDSVDTS